MGLLAVKVLTHAAALTPVALAAGKATHNTRKLKKRVDAMLHPHRKDVVTMKKSTFIALIAVLSAIAGALGAAYLYLRHRETELDEYEQLLFSEDFTQEAPEAEAAEEAAPAQPAEAAAPANT